MTAYDLRKDGTTGFGAVARPRVWVAQRTVSVNATNYAGVAGTTNGGYMLQSVGAGDTVKILNIPAGAMVLDVRLEVLTLGTGNLSVGDSGSGTQYMAATSIGSTGFKSMAATPGIKMYTAADYILLTYASANDGATASQLPVVKVTVVFIDHTNHAPATTFTP